MPRTLIIAEAGVNHNGSMELAKQLIDVAAASGADYVKFQTFRAENIVAKQARMADYQQENTGTTDQTQFEMLKKLELTPTQHQELLDYCEKRNIRFFSTAFDLESIDYLQGLNLGLWKVPSGEITNFPYLKKIAQNGEPVILSTGMCNMADITDAIAVLEKFGVDRTLITILHCNTEYPTPMDDVNLLAMRTIADEFGVKVGYSDHTVGIEIPIAAVALGASVIEKHFTLSRNLPGPDHKASLEPHELTQMVNAIRNVEAALGSAKKEVTASEAKNIAVARKSIVALRDIRQGEIFSEENITVKRPGNGISPMRWEEILGREARRGFTQDELIEI